MPIYTVESGYEKHGWEKVFCRVRSGYDTKSVVGTIVQRCDNANVYVLKLDHAVDFKGLAGYVYPKGCTILVNNSEIMK